MCRRTLAALVAAALLPLGAGAGPAHAAAAGGTAEPVITVVYTTAGGDLQEEVRLLDLMLGQFSGNITLMPDRQVRPEVVRSSTHLVYFGLVPSLLPEAVVDMISDFDGPILAIGENIVQFSQPFGYVDVDTSVQILGISEPGQPRSPFYDLDIPANRIRIRDGEELLWGWTGDGTTPLLVRSGRAYYLATSFLHNPVFDIISVKLHGFFDQVPPDRHRAFIRLEDIHPAADAELVKAVGSFLADRGVPFALVVIPVYINPETLEQIHLRDRPDLVAVLRDLQRRGGSVVLHGYTHQYRSSETGEGFEFWDVERSRPVYQPADAGWEVPTRSSFASEAEYQAYLQRRQAFERHYVRSRIERGIRELTDLGLVPLAFEAPHYTMSQQGYAVVAEYFDHLLGQVQLGDRFWELMYTSTYPSRPSFLRGMTVIPENVGYYDITSPAPLDNMMKRIQRLSTAQGAMISLFYHPYLGPDRLKHVIEAVEAVPNLEWLDLQDLADPGLLEARWRALNDPFALWRIMAARFARDVAQDGWFSIAAWCLAGVAAALIVTFAAFTLRNRLAMGREIFAEAAPAGRRQDD